MPPIKKAEEGLRYSLKFVYPLLWLIGAWPYPPTIPFSVKLRQICQRIFVAFMLIMFLIPSTLLPVVKVKNHKSQIKMFMPIMNVMSQCIKYSILMLHADRLKKNLDDMKQDWLTATDENLLIMRTKAKIVNRVAVTMIGTMYGSGLCYRLVLPLVRGHYIRLHNNISIRLLPCAGYYGPIDEYKSPTYEIIYGLQVLCGVISYTILCGSMTTIALLGMHTAAMLEILMNKMIDLSEHPNISDKSVQDKCVDIIKYHIKIKRFLQNVEQITEGISLCEIFFGVGLVCVLAYSVITEWEESNAVATIILVGLQAACICALYTNCFIGQTLLNESNNLGTTSITLNWYRFPMDKARYLILIINMSNHPIRFTAAKTIDVSLATFTDIVKLAFGYLNILRDVV